MRRVYSPNQVVFLQTGHQLARTMYEADDFVSGYCFMIVILFGVQPLTGMLFSPRARFYIPRANFLPFLFTGILPPSEINTHR